MSKKKKKKRLPFKERMMNYITDNKGNTAPSQGTVFTFKTCEHDGLTPILIGGYPVHLAKRHQAHMEIVTTADLIFALNGDMPWAPLGTILPMVACELQDRGGVPLGWEDFIQATVAEIKKGKKILGYCTGSHGRTGCFAASLIALLEPDTADPVAAIRERHCKEAVETLAQVKAVFALKGAEVPAEYLEEFKPFVSSFGGKSGRPMYNGHDFPSHVQTPDLCLKCGTDFKEYQQKPCITATTAAGTSSPSESGQGFSIPGTDQAHYMSCTCHTCLDNNNTQIGVQQTDAFKKHSKGCPCHDCKKDHPFDPQCLCDECWESPEAEEYATALAMDIEYDNLYKERQLTQAAASFSSL